VALCEFTGPDGEVWRVWNTVPTSRSATLGAVAPGMEEGWLTFENSDEKRRLFPIPSGWTEYPEDRLRELLRASHPVTRGR